MRAQRQGRSLEAEAREILRAAAMSDDVALPTGAGLGSRIASRFAGLGLDEDIAEQRGQAPRPAEF